MARKVFKRVADPRGGHSDAENLAWLAAEARDPADLARNVDADLWDEATEFGAGFRARARSILDSVPHELGGGGAYEFLYWLTRLRRPEVVVETGVAAGWTSQAFLAALDRNGRGTLYSSDFPYFRLAEAESYVGCLVDDRLKARWHLYLDGDANNLPRILHQVQQVDLFHYDSDKSYSGRAFAMNTIREKLTPDGLVVMDDLHNNSWFYDTVAHGEDSFGVFGDGERFGVIGDLPGL
jgi:predicted O-methyltransferase YrrM